ncbi:MAG: tRNA pseudouridine(38-40) synthase TruA [Clostridia bacterium]|nr:tRNA pseudouridine(38-40) synthase TruA [Clostridia bacterium]
MKLLLKISYLGTEYSGFQCQKNGNAIQNVLTEAAEKVFGFPCDVTGCSRTDAGVHALGFCCTVAPKDGELDNWCSVPVGKIHRAFAQYLPADISVIAAAEVSNDFHPRYASKGKEYVYKIWDGKYDDPFVAGRAYRHRRGVSDDGIRRMQKAAENLVGYKDFTSFMASGSKITDARRTVLYANVERTTDGMICFTVAADGFLYNMVRIMAGTLLDCAHGKYEPEDINRMIESKNRNSAGFTAAPEGLYLSRVFYEEEIEWKCD